jgi:hypothetical protein
VAAPTTTDQIAGPHSIIRLSPDASINANESDSITFAWKPDASLEPNQVYELVFGNINGGELKAINTAAINTSVLLMPGKTLPPGDYKWGVYLAQEKPYFRLRYLGDGGNLHISGSSSDSSSGNNDGGGSNEPGGRP